MTKELIQPPGYKDLIGPVIFLGGPIQGAPNWQGEATLNIHNLNPDIAVASPRKDYAPGEFVYEAQVDWETHYLNRAAEWGAVLFWLAKEAEDTR